MFISPIFGSRKKEEKCARDREYNLELSSVEYHGRNNGVTVNFVIAS